MNSRIMESKLATCLLAAAMALALAACFAAPAQAHAQASVTAASVAQSRELGVAAASKSVKAAKFSTSTAAIKKAATTVKKGTTKLNVKAGAGYIKFTAPKKKTYSFRFSNLKSAASGTHIYSAFVEVQTQSTTSPEYSFMIDVATKGGKYQTLWLAEKGYEGKGGKLLYRGLSSRSGKIALQKGQDIYFYFSSGTKNTNVTLKVS